MRRWERTRMGDEKDEMRVGYRGFEWNS